MTTRVHPPQSIRDICATLEKHGHEAWCVGGAVRDALLGIETLDWDIATSAHPEQVQKLFRRTVPVGIKFGTVGVLDRDGVLHEVTTFRHDVETDGRHAVVRYGASLDEDLARRDFTINAIALHPERLELRDPFHGRRDLEAKIVRAVGEPAERMREDRLRALRALRFAGRFAFAIDPATWDAVRESAPHLGRLSMERVKQELEKVMEQVAAPSATLERYRAAGIFAALVPALAQAPRERFAAIDHLARPGLRGRPDRRSVRLAALFVEPGQAPPRDLEKTLKHLKYSNVEVKATVAWAEALGAMSLDSVAKGTRFSDADLRRRIARVGRLAVPAVARLLGARAAAEAAGAALGGSAPSEAAGGGAGRTARALYRRALRIAWRDPLTVADLAVDGEDLHAAGVSAGRAIGDTLSSLLEQVLDDPTLNTRDALLARVAAGVSARADTLRPPSQSR
ncbi:MAG: CCA tRNA nucleotidyltransferase [Gemmatimonadaceae bacterium]